MSEEYSNVLMDGFDHYVLVKSEATDGLLASMALRYRHDFGILPRQEQQTILAIMRQIHEEVVGKGFYNPDAEDKYKRAIKDE